jgi:hypothetical protein
MYIHIHCELNELIKNTFIAPAFKQKKKKETLNFEFSDPQKNLVRNILFNNLEAGRGCERGFEYKGDCWWCRHSFKSEFELGCPIKYNRDENKYITEGSFCSVSCVKSYLREKICTFESLYKDSPMLLSNYALDLGLDPDVSSAPSWKLLKAYRGYMSIDEFRNPSSRQIKETINYRLENSGSKSMNINNVYHNFN